MGYAELIEVPDNAVLRTVDLLLLKHTKQGEAGVVNLIYTGKRHQDLLALETLTTRPHYGIRGFLEAHLDARAESVRLLDGACSFPRVRGPGEEGSLYASPSGDVTSETLSCDRSSPLPS